MNESTKEFLHSLHPLLPEDIVPVQSEEFEFEKIPCCFLLRDKNNPTRLIKLNQTGILIWELCTDNRTIGQMVDMLSEAFEQERIEMARDISRIVDYLIEEKALLIDTI